MTVDPELLRPEAAALDDHGLTGRSGRSRSMERWRED